MQPAPLPSNVRPRDAPKYKDMAVQHEVTAPDTFEATTTPEALQQLLPQLFKTSTAAKKACRCASSDTRCLELVSPCCSSEE